ncbi:MAG TPA: MBL fold metallo-hydrolase [Polyangiaceae bacterium]
MIPISDALRELGVSDRIQILPVLSGYPSPKIINLVLRHRDGQTYLFEASAARTDIISQIESRLASAGVERLDALLVTHCHGDHAGSAGVIAGWGRPEGERAPVYLHSAGYRFLTQPNAAFLHETYELFLMRAHWGLIEYNRLSEKDMIENVIRKRFANYFVKTPKSALRFVDEGQLPPGIVAVPTPGHSWDCVLYYDAELEIAVPGDTIICTGLPDLPESHAFVIPIFTVAGQSYSMAYERYLHTIAVLRRFFQTHRVRAVLPPHGRFAVTEPLAWVEFAETYFCDIYDAFLRDFLADEARRSRPFRACDLNAVIPSAGAHPISTPSHTFGMLCALADEGYLSLHEDPHTRHIDFQLERPPPPDYVRRRLAEDPGKLTIYAGTS